MSLTALGLNHKTAALPVRERLSFTADALEQALKDAASFCHTQNCIILSTCNRTEIYTLGVATERVIDWLAQSTQMSQHELMPHLYVHQGVDAMQHIIRVAAGLDSMIMGEPQIFGQIKQALAKAQNLGLVGKQMHWLFAQIVASSKQVRSQTSIGQEAVSLGFAATKLTAQIFSQPTHEHLLLVGAGEMNQLIAQHMCQFGLKKITIANRTLANAEVLARALNEQYPVAAETAELNALERLLPSADILCSCTGSMQPLVTHNMVKKAIKLRRYQPMLLIDLAVPRDIETQVGKIEEVYHYAIDDLQKVIEGNLAKRRKAAVDAEVLVSQLAVSIQQARNIKEIGKDIAQFKNQAQGIKAELLAQADKELAAGANANAVLEKLANKLTAKLMHGQFKLMREAANIEEKHVQTRIIDTLQDALDSSK